MLLRWPLGDPGGVFLAPACAPSPLSSLLSPPALGYALWGGVKEVGAAALVALAAAVAPAAVTRGASTRDVAPWHRLPVPWWACSASAA